MLGCFIRQMLIDLLLDESHVSFQLDMLGQLVQVRGRVGFIVVLGLSGTGFSGPLMNRINQGEGPETDGV
jgi:hypothetical protein